MPTSFGNISKEFLYQETKYSESYSFIFPMGKLFDVIFFFWWFQSMASGGRC